MARTAAGLVLALLVLTLFPGTAHAGTGVERAQRRLNELGCNAGPIDGNAGEWTRSAVIRFQSRHRLSRTGTLNDATRKRLYGDRARRCDTRPVPAGSGKGRRIVVSQRQNWVWLVGRNGRVVAQSGMIDNPAELDTGWEEVGSYCGRAAKIERNATPDGDLHLDNFTRFAACGIGFHRIPTYASGGGQIHPDWMVGTDLRASHGCIRLPNAFSERLWDFASVGTRVRVVAG